MTRGRRRQGPSHKMRTPGAGRSPESQALIAATTAQPTATPELSRTVLAIAGLDPSGGAGISADLKTIAAYRQHGVAVVTSVTAQNTVGIQAIFDLPVELVRQQIETIVADIDVHAVKIGMLGTARTVALLASMLQTLHLPHVVLDPVLKSTSGTPLLEKKGITELRDALLPRVDVVTPNMEEASILARMAVTDLPSMKAAARAIHDMGARAVVVTGGHLGNRAVDVVYDGTRTAIFDSTKIVSANTHGIGCTFSTALACQLSRGVALAEAVDGAKRYVSRAVSHVSRIGRGAGPLNHLVSPF